MMKLKSFFVGLLLFVMVFIMMLLVALIYRANEGSSIRSYIFQMDNYASQRIGEIQNIDNISMSDLRNKLIKKYVSEYFKIIPGDINVVNRPILLNLSSPAVFNQWKTTEAQKISELSGKNVFRMVHVSDDGIALLNDTDNKKLKDGSPVYYVVRYDTLTWQESNIMKIEPEKDQGSIVLEIRFEPGITDKIHGEKINVKKYLESGKNPVGLFKFRVINIINKD